MEIEYDTPPPQKRGYDEPFPKTGPVNKKRKRRSTNLTEEVVEDSKSAHFDQSGRESGEGLPWKNLQLVLSLQDKNTDLLKKVDLAFDYVESNSTKELDDTSRRTQVMDASRTIVFLSNWIQSVLISSEKKIRLEENKPEFGSLGSLFDLRCWKILLFCLEESKNLHVPLTCLRDFLRVIHSVVMDASSCVNDVSLSCEGTFSGERQQFYGAVLDCILLVFSFHGGVANENLDLWILLIDRVLELILKIITSQLEGGKIGNFICYLFEPFVKFLRVHPTRKNGFHNFIDKLLEPLLHLLHLLRSSSCGSYIEWRTNLTKLVEEVLAQGLFHPTHIDGFLNLQSTIRYRHSSDAALKEEKMVNKSYHRHLFDQVEKIVSKKNGLALTGLGELLHLFVSCVTKHKGASVSGASSRQSDASSTCHVPDNLSQSGKVTSEKIPVHHKMDAELRKAIFDFFVQILEYLLADLNKYLQPKGEGVSALFDVFKTLRSINNLLARFICDKLYLRTEDVSEGASINFLRLIYATVTSFSSKLDHQEASSFSLDEKPHRELLISVRRELVVTVHHLLNIEYEVVGDDLESLWTMVFSSAACYYSSMDVLDQPLPSEILSFSCRLIDLYSELRQVDSSIVALCRAVRQSLSLVGASEASTSSGSCSSYSSSLSMLFCSLEFRSSLKNAIHTIPEGQASGCIRQLSSDLMESLEWMYFGRQLADLSGIGKSNPHGSDPPQLCLRAELLGKVLCDVYVIILDSIVATSGNSSLVGVSLKNLIEIIRSSLSSLVSLETDSSKELSVLVDGRTLSKSTGCDNESLCWILVVFFRLLLSCRSLFRQAISLMPSCAAKKMCGVIGDSITSHSGMDWLQMTGSASKGFFSWILEPSVTLLNVIHSVLDICIQDSFVLSSPMVYVLNVMALQRLADLNKLIECSEFMLEWNRTGDQLRDDADVSSYHERKRRWKKDVKEMRKEAEGLQKFMQGVFSSIAKDQIYALPYDNEVDVTIIQGLECNETVNFVVGSLDKRSLPSALWWIICGNVGIWCSHASKKHLKNFLKLIIRASLPCINNHGSKPGPLKKVTAHQIALEFLSNTISYEQKFVSRYMASSFCKILKKSVSSIFANSDVDLSESPDWGEVIYAVESSSDAQNSTSPWTKPSMMPAESWNKQINVGFTTCQYLLTFLMQMPQEYLNLKSSSLYITCILNLERLLVGSLLGWRSVLSSHSPYQIFRLFVICRKVLQTLTMASSEENVNGSESPVTSKHPECLLPMPWLLKSLLAVIGSLGAFPEDIASEAKVEMFLLLDHTSNVLLTVSGERSECAVSSLISAKKLRGERKNLDPGTEESNLSECNLHLNTKENLDACQSVLNLAEALEECLQKSLTTLRDMSHDKKVDCLAGFQDLNKLSSIIGCFQGLLWGLASTLGNRNAVNSNFKLKFSSCNADLMTKTKSCVDLFVNYSTYFLKSLFLEEGPTLDMSGGGNALAARESPSSQYDGFNDASNEGLSTGKMAQSDIKGDLVKRNLKRKSSSAMPDLEAFLTGLQHQKLHLKKSLLLQVLSGDNADAAFFLRQLFLACSAILRLNLHIDLTSLSQSLFPIVVDISQFLLLEFSRSEKPHQYSFSWLDGAVKFLEELGNYFPQFDPMLSRDFYVKLIDIHLRVIGKCISLQGKEAELASQETGSCSKNLANIAQSCFSSGTSQLGKLKERLRMSFRTYVKISSEFHLLSAIQAVERALVGVQEGLMTNYEIVCGSSNGGEVSPVVAAGIDVLDLILEFVTGPRRLNMIKRHIQSLVACLFNVILHLQGPSIFCEYVDSIKAYQGPDSGFVVLMCIEVLTKISGKPYFFQIDGYHIAESLRVPGALFQYFLQLQISETPLKVASGNSTRKSSVDRKFSVELYAACCRMLCTALKHHKSDTRQCITLLEDSVSVLLHCLETVNLDRVAGRGSCALEVQEAVKCASSLRRVYEEVRQQKDVFGQCSFQFLSRYIWVYCGLGPARNGIMREVDQALKPGVYALIDSCSADDLQLLHTVFGEGPCRSTLAALQHDYKLHFQFKGKV